MLGGQDRNDESIEPSAGNYAAEGNFFFIRPLLFLVVIIDWQTD